MLSMQKTPSYTIPPSASYDGNNNNNRPHLPPSANQAVERRNSTRSVMLADVPALADCPLVDDSPLSHRNSISTNDDISNDSPVSWDGDGPSDSSPTAEVDVKVHDGLHHPFSTAAVVSPKAFRFNLLASHLPDAEVTPKIEEIDDVDELQSIKPVGVETLVNANPDATAAPVHVPRKRGRPRKHPLPVPGGQLKITKGRSKTGCITCRRRKKKCDETKPACLNCQKNAVVCEGYPPKEIWKSGKQKLEDAYMIGSNHRMSALSDLVGFTAARSHSMVARSLPLLIDGVETEIDRRFLDHFVYGFSRVLTLINDDSNPFKEILLPMATQHRGLMHSLMCLSGSHLSALDPEPKLKERKYYHFHRAIRDLKDNITASSSAVQDPELLVEDPIIASTIALSLNTICEGETNGEYRPHMDAARYLLVTQQPRNEKFRQFIVEFFQYHDVSNSITSLDRRPSHLQGGLRLPDFVPHAQAGMFLGVFDGLFNYISEVTRIRDRIRQRSNEGYEPAVDYQILGDAVSIDSAIRAWETSYAPNTPNYFLAQLYRQSTWVYLYRTIRPSRPSEKIAQVVDDGLAFLDQLPQDAGAYSIVLMPLFLLGCSAFIPRQRERITKGFESLKAYSNLRNIEPARKVVERVWEVMDTKMEESWDWEKIISGMNMDFLIT
ncbi:C6 transcription factor [Aspergillus heteromorphus CBS 117.55]|uniref:C6 transcription factor n=1 Tax=Aspergillus heteromorphus CBS 117.55 TaxID=1448321 RepID=A0A317X7H6_9EURO|nr:C6 transcription factor [Aspergillus heteromorphus CBS 117.55]PWY92550.1 C6 transcription factor [Aspergillus heteromorphus CBS 117.55]